MKRAFSGGELKTARHWENERIRLAEEIKKKNNTQMFPIVRKLKIKLSNM